jgi:hypothetical protein
MTNTTTTAPTNLQDTIATGKEYSRTNWVVVLSGILGFVVAIWLLFGLPWNNRNRFHEIDINLKVADSSGRVYLRDFLEKHYNDTLAALNKAKAININGANKTEVDRLIKNTDSLNNLRKQLASESYSLDFNNDDTLEYFMVRMGLHRGQLLKMVNDFDPASSKLSYKYFVPQYAKDAFTITTNIKSTPFVSSHEFITKYPNFAFWAFIAILFMVLCFLIIPICLFIFESINKQITSLTLEHNYKWNFILAATGVVVFSVLLYLGIIRTYIANDKFFMAGFERFIYGYAIVGYIVALFCFAGYLYIADLIHQLQGVYKEGDRKLAENRKTALAEAANDPAKIALINEQPAIKDQIKENDLIKEHYKSAKKYFDIFLLMSALVLSVVVLMTGSLFSSINSMDVFRYYRYISGQSYLSGDLVYLYGGLHTVLLLIFVLPVKFKIYDMNMTIPELRDSNSIGGDKSIKTVFSGVKNTIGDILLVASPVLASFLERIVTSLFS